MSLTVVASDVHVPYHNTKLWRGFVKFCSEKKPQLIYFNGDLIDLDAISRYVPKRSTAWQAIPQVKRAVQMLNELQALCPDTSIKIGMGNHEARWAEAILGDKKRELDGAIGLTLEEQMRFQGLDERIIFHRDNAERPGIEIWGYRIAHGDKTFGRYGKLHVAHGLLTKFWRNYAVGHFHKAQLYCYTTGSKVAVGLSIPTMQERQDFCADPSWQQGFLVLSKSRLHRGDVVCPYLVIAQDGRFSYDGTLY